MTTSGTYTEMNNFDNASIIDEAFRRIKISPANITSDHIVSALVSLNLMFISWLSEGAQQFIIDQEIQTLNPDPNTLPYTALSFTMPEGSIDVISMIFRDGINQDIQIKPMSRQDYLYVNTKLSQGQPVSYFVDKTTIPPTVYLWPVQNISGTQVVYNRLRRVQDIGSMQNTPDATFIYLEAIVAGLAAKLAEKYSDTATEDRMIEKAAVALSQAMSTDRDRTPLIIKPRLGRRYQNGV